MESAFSFHCCVWTHQLSPLRAGKPVEPMNLSMYHRPLFQLLELRIIDGGTELDQSHSTMIIIIRTEELA